ncbi:MAG TPA: HDOD domain-containing protein [Nocardioides sp.]|nr:HDOD domain-containing protein [Nocardioides sp.]
MSAITLDLEDLLEGLDEMASQRPVAAQVVATTNKETADAAELTSVLSADVVLTAKVMRLANSAYFGLSGKVSSLRFAVTVVGFNTVRSVATVALSGVDAAEVLPERFWDTSIHMAAASANLAPQFQEVPTDAMCLGLLTQLGAALLCQADPTGYAEIASTTDLGMERFAVESLEYGICSPQLTAEALQQWHFPAVMVEALRAVPLGPEGALLRTAYELTGRMVYPAHKKTPLDRLSDRRVTESLTPTRMAAIRSDVSTLRAAFDL